MHVQELAKTSSSILVVRLAFKLQRQRPLMSADNTDMLKKWMRKRFAGQEQQLDTFFAEVSGYGQSCSSRACRDLISPIGKPLTCRMGLLRSWSIFHDCC